MKSLWLSLTTGLDQSALRRTTRGYLDGWFAAQQISDALVVITELVRRAEATGRSGELILSRHDDTLLIELTHRTSQRGSTPAADDPLHTLVPGAYTWGTHPTNTGTVIWVAMPADVPSR